MPIVYKATNQINGKGYIGQTILPLKRRQSVHFTSSNCTVFANALRKYGKDNFVWDILFETDDLDALDVVERRFIASDNTLVPHGYNLECGGKSNKTVSEESRKKMSEANKGEKNPNFGKPLSEDHKRRISESNKGKSRCSGEKNYGAKLTEMDVRFMRHWLKLGHRQKEIAESFGITSRHVSVINTGGSWRHNNGS